MQYEVLKPLYHEISVKDKLTVALQNELDLLKKNFKKVYSILKTPRLCTEFHERRKHVKQGLNDHEMVRNEEINRQHYLNQELQNFDGEKNLMDSILGFKKKLNSQGSLDSE